VKIAKVLGTSDLNKYLDKYDLTLEAEYDGLIGRWPKKPWRKFVTDKNEHLVTDEAIDLLDKMLQVHSLFSPSFSLNSICECTPLTMALMTSSMIITNAPHVKKR
jgi:hypothetical protein